jgi:quercetin dioxygenase-like cupin family protein
VLTDADGRDRARLEMKSDAPNARPERVMARLARRRLRKREKAGLRRRIPGPGEDHIERAKGTFMKTTRIMAIAALIATTGLALPVGQAQQVGARRIDLQRHDLSVTGREVIQTIFELAPGTTAPRHTHPGEEIIYVLEGLLEYQVEGKAPVTVKAGEVFFVPAETIHAVKNVGTGNVAELATFVVEKGKPLIVLVE